MINAFRYLLLIGCLLLTFTTLPAQQAGREWEEIGAPKDVQRILEHFPEGSTSGFAMVPMRDGTRLATSYFLPPGQGPWPVIFCKGFYGRFAMAGYARDGKEGQVAMVFQDARGRFDSEGNDSFDPASFKAHIPDTADALDWIAKQPWCNGRIGIRGGSGNGVAAYTGFLSGSPHLVVASGGNSSGHSHYWMADNRVRRGLYDWMSHNNLSKAAWPRPTLISQSRTDALRELAGHTPHPDTVMHASAAWYDIVSESALDLFALHADKARIYVTVSPGWHGGATEINGAKWPNFWSRGKSVPGFTELLMGEQTQEPSFIRYYLMGDPSDPQSAGNEWRVTTEWPVPSTPLRLHLHANGGISAQPASSPGSLSYIYDPSDPTPAIGGNGSYSIPVGPLDQRPLAGRQDLLRFVSDPLTSPLTVVGNLTADLYVSTDAPDTQFVVKVVDIHEDGTETLIRESAAMARYAEGLDGRTPLQAGKVYHLNVDLWSTAKVFNAGHRIGVTITSAAELQGKDGKTKPVYEVHPNTFDQVHGMEQAQTATQTLHLSARHPSSITLPVVRE
jgi:predicted acyl esterase